jgi:hypothetical protein
MLKYVEAGLETYDIIQHESMFFFVICRLTTRDLSGTQ